MIALAHHSGPWPPRAPWPTVPARVEREELECHLNHLEVHRCSECDAPIAFCRIHQQEPACNACGLVF